MGGGKPELGKEKSGSVHGNSEVFRENPGVSRKTSRFFGKNWNPWVKPEMGSGKPELGKGNPEMVRD